MSEKNKTCIEKIFYVLLCLVAATCLLCAIVSTVSLTSEKKLWKENLEDALQSISACAVKVGNFIDNNVAEANAQAKTEKTTEADASSEKGSQTDNGEQQSSLPTAKEAADYSEMQKIADKTVDYVERLQKVQENSSKNSIMSFIYAVLGAVLTAVGAALVGFIFKNKEMAAEARMEAEKAKAEAEKAKEEAENALEDAKISKGCMDDAIDAQQTAAKNAEFAEQSYKNQVAYQENVLNIQSILIEIAYARFALIDFDKNDANNHIRRNIKKGVKKISSDCESSLIEQLRLELGNLREFIEQFNNDDYVKKGLSQRIANCDEEDIASFKTAVDDYCNIIEEAIRRCEEILDNHAEDLIQ